ncbi:amidohydrolase [bacterium (candidate division B38) B3_B38]|nr:MAG: amidohydrolase [bacterium (candidate division B38) B3_B38]
MGIKAYISVFLGGLLIIAGSLGAGESLQKAEVYAITNATIVPVTAPIIEKGTVVISRGRIIAVGAEVEIPQEANVIDAQGMYVYPAMINSCTILGLYEIGSVRATLDSSETGKFNPDVRVAAAINHESVHIPITRSVGIALALVAPRGGTISGQSALIRLEGWNWSEMLVKSPVGLHISFPQVRARRRAAEEEDEEAISKAIQELKDYFTGARHYMERKEGAAKDASLTAPPVDMKFEAMIPALKGELPVIVSVTTSEAIKEAIKFVEEMKLKAIFHGVSEGWKVVDELKKADIPVILSSLYGTPREWKDGYDAPYRNAGILCQAGIKVVFSTGDAALANNLPYHAAKAAAFGLPKEEALKGVTIYPAQIFGVDKDYGSIEVGKVANIIVTDGCPLEITTQVRHVLIDGKPVDLSNKHTELYEKYRKKK